MFWISSVFIDEEGQSATVVVTREGYHGRADVVGRCMFVFSNRQFKPDFDKLESRIYLKLIRAKSYATGAISNSGAIIC